jgi:hypothetical protein
VGREIIERGEITPSVSHTLRLGDRSKRLCGKAERTLTKVIFFRRAAIWMDSMVTCLPVRAHANSPYMTIYIHTHLYARAGWSRFSWKRHSLMSGVSTTEQAKEGTSLATDYRRPGRQACPALSSL